MRWRSWGIAVLLTSALVSCASSGTGSRSLGDTDFILREEINEALSARSAYDLVQSRRPQWLITRGTATRSQAAGDEGIAVYLDNARLEGVEAMRRVTLSSVQYLQFLSASQATQRWGGGHLHGAILISTRMR